LFSERTDARDPHLDNLLDQAEEEMLRLTCERAELGNGQDILELGCGWGSLSLFVATKYPDSRITAISNSATQKLYIDSEAKRLNLSNLKVVTCDVNFFKSDERYDRVVSVEMFEHMKNYKELLRRISGWLRPEGKLFVHIFCHRQFAYHYKNDDGNDWLTEHFFTGGTMPSADLFLNFQDDLRVSRQWHVNGRNYQLTAEAWLQKMDRNKRQVELIFQKTYGTANVQRWWVYWRLFFLACAELWGFRGGNEWFVAHYLFSQAQSSRTRTRDGALSVMIGSQQNNVIA
jgi:cyclopropane-fatty-acyl-phospholipid synthase